ncbi:unnamed protein product [Vitrella brassicaformis CCMP3155]|uniref:Abscisic acid G-protein coupled receptor-like domain-containing protein n=1 Tax=Vitrella brassicaformis (strain CCMP3155) TaxID=1169540 RepID=A0A0G4ELK8_VITBC|nr:unnamed protein product [Vitrella brassicaformis CCMP3155]|eukprot:CEL97847.1 unnamed protein product [Vitrella brassicaformis CCMP3155]
MSVSNVMLRRVIQEDPASLFLSAAFGLLRVPIDVAVWSPYVSLLFLGLIIALNIRGFISKLLTVFRFVSTSVSSNVFALAMSEIMGLYFSACALLLRIYLPEQYREGVTSVMGPSIDFSAFHLHFDLVFCLSCVASFVLIAFTHTHRFDKFKAF